MKMVSAFHPAGYVYATAQTVIHVDFEIDISPTYKPSPYLGTAVRTLYGDCASQTHKVSVGMFVGVDQAKTGIGLAASLLTGVPFIGWSVSI